MDPASRSSPRPKEIIDDKPKKKSREKPDPRPAAHPRIDVPESLKSKVKVYSKDKEGYASKTRYNHHLKNAQKAEEMTTLPKLINDFFKIIKGVGNIIGTCLNSESGNLAAKYTGFAGDAFKVIAVPKAFKNILDSVSKNKPRGKDRLKDPSVLKREKFLRKATIISALFQIQIAATSVIKCLDALKAIKIAELNASMGKIPVIGTAVAAILPFTIVATFLEIGKNIVDIGIATVKLKALAKKITSIQKKSAAFNVKANPENIAQHIGDHVAQIETKLKRADLVLINIEKNVKKTGDRVTTASDIYKRKVEKLNAKKIKTAGNPRILKFFREAKSKQAVKAAEANVLKAKRKHDKVCNEREDIENYKSIKKSKLGVWKKVQAAHKKNQSLNAPANATLVEMIGTSQQKYKIQKINCRQTQFKEGVEQVMRVAATIVLIATVVLFFTGTSTPSATISIAAIFLGLAFLGICFEIYNKRKVPKIPASMDFKKLAAAA